MDTQARALRLVTLTVVVVACLYVSTVQLSGVDFWLQAKIGELIVTDGRIPDTLLFPFTEIASEKFNAHEWLVSVAFHILLKALGDGGMALFTAVLGLAYFSLALRLSYIRSSGNYPVALLGAMAAIATENYRHVLRPELVSLILMGAYWISLENFKRKPGWRWGLSAAALTVLWANSHGSFILAPIMVGMYGAGTYVDELRQARVWWKAPSALTLHYGALVFLVCAACLVNPFGLELVQFVFNFSNSAGLSKIVGEWMPSLTTNWYGEPGFWLSILFWTLSVGVLVWRRRDVSATDFLFFAFFTLLAIKAVRFPLYLGLVFAFLFSGLCPQLGRSAKARQGMQIFALLVAVIVIVLATRFGNAHGKKPYSPGFIKFSDEMVHVLSDPAYVGNVLNSMELGAELIYVAYPRLKPSSDCRVDSYGLDYLEFLLKVASNDKLLEEFVARYDVRYLLLEPRRFDTFQKLDAWKSGRWTIVAMDKSSVFLKRNDH